MGSVLHNEACTRATAIEEWGLLENLGSKFPLTPELHDLRRTLIAAGLSSRTPDEDFWRRSRHATECHWLLKATSEVTNSGGSVIRHQVFFNHRQTRPFMVFLSPESPRTLKLSNSDLTMKPGRSVCVKFLPGLFIKSLFES